MTQSRNTQQHQSSYTRPKPKIYVAPIQLFRILRMACTRNPTIDNKK